MKPFALAALLALIFAAALPRLYAQAPNPTAMIASTDQAEVCASDGMPGSSYSRKHRIHRWPTRQGFEHDHIMPLCLGGADSETNLQWQPRSEARAKDALERFACQAVCKFHTASLATAQSWFLGDWRAQLYRVKPP